VKADDLNLPDFSPPLVPLDRDALAHARAQLSSHLDLSLFDPTDDGERGERLLRGFGLDPYELAETVAHVLTYVAESEGHPPAKFALNDALTFAFGFNMGAIIIRLATEYAETQKDDRA
jgi:hypothetical protein